MVKINKAGLDAWVNGGSSPDKVKTGLEAWAKGTSRQQTSIYQSAPVVDFQAEYSKQLIQNQIQNNVNKLLSDPVQSQKLAAAIHGMQQPTAEQLDIYKKDDEGKKSAELQTKLDRINTRMQSLSISSNPEYAADDPSADIIELSDLLFQKRNIEKEKSAYDKAYAAHPVQLTESEQQAKGYKDQVKTVNDKIITTIFDPNPYADYGGMAEEINRRDGAQKQYHELVNSEQYIKDNYARWVTIADPNTVLTTAEKQEVADAAKLLKLYYQKNFNFWKADDPENKELQKYSYLAGLLDTKTNKQTSLSYGAFTVIPGAKQLLDWAQSAPLNKALNIEKPTDAISDPTLRRYIDANVSNVDISARANPVWFTSGQIAGNVALFEAGATGLRALSAVTGVKALANPVVINSITMSANTALNDIANGDKWDTVVINTVTSGIAAAGGTAFGNFVGGKVANYLENFGFSEKVKNALAASSNGVSFAVAQSAIEESKNAVIYGADYKPDATGIAVNILTSILFGSLEAFKNNPKAVELQNRLKQGDAAAYKETTDFLNKQTEIGQNSMPSIDITRMPEPTAPSQVKDAPEFVTQGDVLKQSEAPALGYTTTSARPSKDVTIDQSTLDLARQHIKEAAESKDFAETKDAFKNKLSEYSELPSGKREIEIKPGADGEAYNVTIDESTYKNVIKDIETMSALQDKSNMEIARDLNISAEKHIVLQNIDAIVKNSTFVNSGKVVSKSGGKTVTAQHDYFEAPVTLGGETYIARFDVTVKRATGENIVTGIDIVKAPRTPGRNGTDTIPDSLSNPTADDVSRTYINQMPQMLRPGTSENNASTLANDAVEGYNGREKLLTNEGAGDAGKIPWDSWQGYEKVTQNGKTYAKVGDRLYSEHAVNRMQPSGNRFGINIYEGLNGEDYGRSIAPQYVEDVINSVKPVFQPRTGNYS